MYQLDIGVLWRNRESARALDLLEFLPPTSHYVNAVAQDDELAAELAKHESDEKPASSGPSLTEWSAEVQHLAVIADALLSLRALFLQANGAKGVTPPSPLPTPQTARQRVKRAERNAVREHVMSKLLPAPDETPQDEPPQDEPPLDE